jgi:[methyl-Co(III) methanol-specific corrinoid protein]:coenzyme M methyltransferase
MMRKANLTGKERVLAVLSGLEVDSLPVLNPTSLITFENMQRTGCHFPQAHLDADKIAALAATGYTVLGFDSIMPYFSLHLEAAALGCNIDWGNPDRLPAVLEYPLKEAGDFKMPANFLDRRPVKALLTAIRSVKQKYGARVAIIGKVVGPWTLAYHLYGAAHFLMDVILEPAKVQKILHDLKQVPVMFAAAQIEAGADIITWCDHAIDHLVSRQTYQDYLLPIHKECAVQLGKTPVILHVCGNVLDRLDLFAQTGFAAFHLDSRNSIPEALKLAGKMQVTGNLNNPRLLLNGSAEDVRAAVHSVIRDGIQLISPECGLPIRMTNANLIEIVKAARMYTNAREAL